MGLLWRSHSSSSRYMDSRPVAYRYCCYYHSCVKTIIMERKLPPLLPYQYLNANQSWFRCEVAFTSPPSLLQPALLLGNRAPVARAMGWDFRRFRTPTILKHADVKAFLSDMAVSHRDLNFLRPSLAVPDYGSGQRNQRQTETLLTARSGRQDP